MATFQTSNENTTVNFDYTASTDKVQEIISLVAEYLHREITDEEGVVTNPFDGLTNQQKLDLVSDYVEKTLINRANAQKVRKAREAVEVEAVSL